MLRGLDPLLHADLLHALASMGHGDELDGFVDTPAHVKGGVGDPLAEPDVVREFQPLVDHAAGRPVRLPALERFAFYERARQAFAVLRTGEAYGNILLTHGVRPERP